MSGGMSDGRSQGGMSGGQGRPRLLPNTWPELLLDRLPKAMRSKLRFTEFSDALVLHPEEPRAMFRPIEELALHYPDEVNLQNKQFGLLSVLTFLHFQKHQRGAATAVHYDRWEVKCECGTIKEVGGNHLRTGNTQSCGCKRKRRAVKK